MHPSILAQRKARAMNRILFAAEALVKQLAFDPSLVAGLQPQGVKDPQALEMMRLEGLADLLDQLALQAGAIKPSAPVTAVTEPAPEPQGESPVSSVPADLPPPVLEEEIIPIEGEPEIEEFPAEDLPAAKPARKGPARRAKKK